MRKKQLKESSLTHKALAQSFNTLDHIVHHEAFSSTIQKDALLTTVYITLYSRPFPFGQHFTSLCILSVNHLSRKILHKRIHPILSNFNDYFLILYKL